MSTIDYLNDRGRSVAAEFNDEANELAKWSGHAGAEGLRELSTIAQTISARFAALAGDFMSRADSMDAADGWSQRDRAVLRLIKEEEIRAEVANGEHWEDAS